MHFDAIVVGAGPAGSSTAIALARQGVRVLVVDKDLFPREKACGDGLTRRSVAALRRMGLEDRFAGARRIRGLRIIEHRRRSEHLHEHSAGGEGPEHGLVVPRIEFDQVLIEAAQESGAEFWQKTLVEGLLRDESGRVRGLRTRGAGGTQELAADFVVVAEGSSGRLAAPLRRSSLGSSDRCFAVRQYCRGGGDVGSYYEVHFPVTDGRVPVPGYGWVFPVADGIVNVGAGVGYGRGFDAKIGVRQLYAGFLETLRKTATYSALEECSPLIGSSLRQGLVPDECVAPGLVLAGDAASLVNPFTGEGISYALESGELAGEAVVAALAAGQTQASLYPRLLRQRFRRHVRLRQEIPDLFGLFRTYDWFVSSDDRDGELEGRKSTQPKSILSASMARMLGDDERREEQALRPRLWSGVLDDDQERKCEGIEDALIESASRIRTLLGEIAYYTREGLFGRPGFASRLLLLLAPEADPARLERVAVLAEMAELSLLFHADIARVEGGEPAGEGRARAERAAGVLLGDAMTATTFELLNELEPHSARALSDAIVRHYGQKLSSIIDSRRLLDGWPASGAAPPRQSFTADLARHLLEDLEPAHPDASKRIRFAAHAEVGLSILGDAWLDLRGHGLDSTLR